jgi:hypothetical protein
LAESTTQSTGPRTEAGKAASSMNALKHGLSITRHVVLPHEDPAHFEALRNDTLSIYEPRTGRERLAIEEVARCRWALQRFEKAESFMLSFPTATHCEDQDPVPQQHKLDFMSVVSDQPGREHSGFIGIHHLLRYRGHWDRRHQRALAEFDRAQRARRADAREARQEREDDRKQQMHELRCELLRARIQRELGRTKQPMPQAEPPAPAPNEFVSSDSYLSPPDHTTEGPKM